MNRKRLTGVLLSLMLVLGTLGTCAGAEEAVTLRFMWWGSDARHEATLKVIDDYMQAHPNVTIEAEYGSDDGYYEKLTTMMASGTEPDIMQMTVEMFGPIAGDTGAAFIPLDSGAIDTTGFEQNFIGSVCSRDGHLRALPTGMGGQIMAINADFFERFGIPLDTQWTWEAIEEWGRKVREQDPDAYLLGGFGGDDATPIGIMGKFYACQKVGTGSWVTNEYTLGFTEDSLTETYAYFTRLLQEEIMQPVDETIGAMTALENTRWVEGNIGMMHSMTSTISSFEVEGMNLDVAACPIAEDALDSGFTVTPTQLLAVSAGCKHPETAMDFLNYFYNDPAAIQVLGTVRGSQPTTGANDVLVESGQVDARNAKAMALCYATSSSFTSQIASLTEFNVVYADITNEVLFGSLTPAEGARQLIDEYEEIIAELREG